MFIDTEKAFDKVWHEGLLYKLKGNISDTMYRIIRSYLSKRTFCVKYETAKSVIRDIVSGVPQGSVLGPVLYLAFAADFPKNDKLTIAHFADDVAILSQGTCETATHSMQNICNNIHSWCCQWRVMINPLKSQLVKFTYKTNITTYQINIGGIQIPEVQSVKYLGLILDSRLTWKNHITNIVQKIRFRIHQLKHLLSITSPLALRYKCLIYKSIIRPIWQYGCPIWSSASATQIRRIQTLQNRCLRIMTGAPWYIRNSTLHNDTGIPEVNKILRSSYIKLYDTFLQHPNPLLRDIPATLPTDPPLRRLKRKWHSDSLLN